MDHSISSLHNPLVKQCLLLQEKSRERRKSGLFLIEGIRELKLALEGGYTIETALICSEIDDKGQGDRLLDQFGIASKRVSISPQIYKKIAYRERSEGVIVIAKAKDHSLTSLELISEEPLILVAEAPEKPGNIGALLRTADAARLDAVIIANPKTDLYNPNIIRSSVGGVFTNKIAMGDTTSIIAFLKQKDISIYAAALQAAAEYHTQDYSDGSAVVVGTEATGLSEEWMENSHQNIIIPMQGSIDSMNVSVAAGILIFEAKRQRNFQ